MDVTAARRARLLEHMGEGVALFATAHEQIRNASSHFRFRPESDFYYLTGFTEPDAVLVLAPHHPKHRYILFVRPRDPEKEVWNGRRLGIEGAISQLGADIAYPIDELETRLPEYLEGAHQLFYPFGRTPDLDRRVLAALYTLRQVKYRLTPSPTRIIDSSTVLRALRVRKEPGELELMRRAAAITGEAHRLAMAYTRPGRHEYELEALIDYTFRRNGGVGPGYPSIVASGENATILHYVENDRRMNDGELLLIDAGAEYRYYTADVTRTWPVSGRFTPAQRDVYEVVLEAQRQAIAAVRPGGCFNATHESALRTLTTGLVSLGVLSGSIDSLLEAEAYKPFYMHRTSHWLGLDVHDAGEYTVSGRFRTLETGMVMTVEPGLYFGADTPGVPKHLRGIGVRIEDDVLVTDDGHEVLTRETPKAIDELEALVGQAGETPLPRV